MTIFKKLKFNGIDIGNVQSVGEMTMVPILGDDRGEVAGPEHLKFRSTTDYGTMVFENDDTQPAIVPANMMVRGKGAQDHAMATSGIVAAGRSTRFNTACCIEESQGGYLGSQGNEEDVLPVLLRRSLLQPSLRQAQSYSKLWSEIKKWLNGVPTESGRNSAHLRYFYDTPDIKEALEQFAAEFEPVDNQIGALIMFSGVPVGIEIMPTNEHWEAYWKLLIRGCYGAEMIRLKLLGKLKPSALIMPDLSQTSSPDDVKQVMENFALHLRQEVVPILETIDVKSQKLTNRSTGSLQTEFINTTSGGGGDLIKQGSTPIYLSLVL